MITGQYKLSRIGYEIKKYSSHSFSALLEIKSKYASAETFPTQESSQELFEHLKLLKEFSNCSTFEEILGNLMLCSDDKFYSEVLNIHNPYSYSKKIYYLSKVMLKWIILNNPPCSELSPTSPIYLDKCV